MSEIIKISSVLGVQVLFSGFFMACIVPNKWLFKNRFWLLGIIAGLFFYGVISMVCEIFDSFQIIICLFFCVLFGGFIVGGGLQWDYKGIEVNTPFPMYQNKTEIASDVAKLKRKMITQSGRLVLTDRRLTFVSNSRGNSQYDFYFSDPKFSISIVTRFRIPIALKIFSEDISIKVKFPLYWIKEIKRIQSLI